MMAIPGNPSDAGPLDCPMEKMPLDWRGWLDMNIEESREALNTYRDDLQAERKLRIEAIERAEAALLCAKTLLLATSLPVVQR